MYRSDMANKPLETSESIEERTKNNLRERGPIYRLNVAHPAVPVEQIADIWTENNIATISDWGFENGYDVELFTTADAPITQDIVADRFKGGFDAGPIDWDAMRDVLADERYSTEENPKHHAGQAKGSIRRFIDEYEVGTVILGNLPQGQVPGVVTSEPYYRPGNPVTNHDPNHTIVREVDWARDANEQLIAIPSESLPEVLQPKRLTTTRVKNSQQLLDVARLLDVLN